MDLDKVQKEIFENKVKKGFNVTDACIEFCLLYGKVAEAFESYNKKEGDLGAELADVAIYLLGLAEILGYSLKDEINAKMKINKNREYVVVNGVKVKKEENKKYV